MHAIQSNAIELLEPALHNRCCPGDMHRPATGQKRRQSSARSKSAFLVRHCSTGVSNSSPSSLVLTWHSSSCCLMIPLFGQARFGATVWVPCVPRLAVVAAIFQNSAGTPSNQQGKCLKPKICWSMTLVLHDTWSYGSLTSTTLPSGYTTMSCKPTPGSA